MKKQNIFPAILCFLFLVLSYTFPPIEEVLFPANSPYAVFRIVLFLASLLPTLLGFGYFARLGLQKVFFVKVELYSTEVSFYLDCVLGMVCLGFATFIVAFNSALVYGQVLCLVLFGGLFYLWRPCARVSLKRGVRSLTVNFRQSNLVQKSFLVLFGVFVLSHLVRIFLMPGHEDGYLYHLSLAELWQRTETTGVLPQNLPSGYAWVWEHFLYFIFVLVKSPFEQTLFAQLFQFVLTVGLFRALGKSLFCSLGKSKGSERGLSFFLTFFILHPYFSYQWLLPKAEGVLLVVSCLSLFAYCERRPGLFVIACFILGAIKISLAPFLAVLALVALIEVGLKRVSFCLWCCFFLKGALAFLSGMMAYVVTNYLRTGNPFFPLFNGLFQSGWIEGGFAPSVSAIMPFSLTLKQFLQSVGLLLRDHFSLLLLLAFCLFKLRTCKDQVEQRSFGLLCGSLVFGSLAVLGFSVLFGAYGVTSEPRFYFPIISWLALVAVVVFMATADFGKSATKTVLVVAILGLLSNVHFKPQRITTLFSTSIVEELFDKKPLLRLLSLFAKAEERILLMTVSNANSFSGGSHVFHQTISYPYNTWDYEAMSSEDWSVAFRRERISIVITTEQQLRKLPHLEAVLGETERTAQEFKAYRSLKRELN